MQTGVIGTGLMGAPIAKQLVESGFEVMAYNRTPEKAQPLMDAGVNLAPDVATLIQNCDRIILMLSDHAAIAELLFSESDLNLQQKLIVQMGTISPSQSQAIAQKVEQAGGRYLEAPVLGSIPEAKTGTLLVMVGGERNDFEEHMNLFQALGKEPRYIGPVGSAAALKLSLNQLIGALTTAFATSLEFCDRNQVPLDQFMDILRASALYAPTFDKKLQRIQEKNFANPNFPTKHLLKDMKLFAEAAGEVNVQTQTSEAIQDIILKAMSQYRDQDYSALSTGVAD